MKWRIKKNTQKLHETKSWFFEPLAELTKERGRKLKLIKLEMKK
jgi:hypothetical protein